MPNGSISMLVISNRELNPTFHNLLIQILFQHQIIFNTLFPLSKNARAAKPQARYRQSKCFEEISNVNALLQTLFLYITRTHKKADQLVKQSECCKLKVRLICNTKLIFDQQFTITPSIYQKSISCQLFIRLRAICNG